MPLSALENKIEHVKKTIEKISVFPEIVGNDTLFRFDELIKDFRRNLAHASQENRLLRIGVVGQIKRGKSSFLNALLFDGEDVLPKAASPMTAALTRIRYGDSLKAEIEFYTEEEWRQVEATAQIGFEKERQRQEAQKISPSPGKGGFLSRNDKNNVFTIPDKATPDEQACMELVDMARQGGQDIGVCLGKIKVLDIDQNISTLNQALCDYVGSSGSFTPFVKSSTLTLNLPVLDNIEVIDTPGINDPIVSRSRVTQQFMGQCDVVFFLSNCGQFLDQADMRLLSQNIPAKGIDDICLIGSLFDSVLIDEGHKYKSLELAARDICQKLNTRAKNDFDKICKQIEQSGELLYMTEALQKSLPPIFVSAMAYNLVKHWEDPNESERKILQRLQDVFNGNVLNRSLMDELANFKEVQLRLSKVRQNKDTILQGKLKKIAQRFEPEFRGEVRQLKSLIERDKKALETGAIKALTQRLTDSAKRLERGKSLMSAVFEIHANDIKKRLLKLTSAIKEEALLAKKISSRSGTETHEESYTVDHGMGILFWRSLTGNRYETKYQTVSVSYTYVCVHDTIDHIESFIVKAEKALMESITESINLEKLRQDILTAAKKIVNFEEDDFDADELLGSVETAISRLTIPEVNLNCERCLSLVTNVFNTPQVRDADIVRLKQCTAEAVNKTLEVIHTAVLENQNKICEDLIMTGKTFINSITQELEDQIKRLNESQEDIQLTLSKYAQVLTLLDSASTPAG